jgi:hypothetical protein
MHVFVSMCLVHVVCELSLKVLCICTHRMSVVCTSRSDMNAWMQKFCIMYRTGLKTCKRSQSHSMISVGMRQVPHICRAERLDLCLPLLPAKIISNRQQVRCDEDIQASLHTSAGVMSYFPAFASLTKWSLPQTRQNFDHQYHEIWNLRCFVRFLPFSNQSFPVQA